MNRVLTCDVAATPSGKWINFINRSMSMRCQWYVPNIQISSIFFVRRNGNLFYSSFAFGSLHVCRIKAVSVFVWRQNVTFYSDYYVDSRIHRECRIACTVFFCGAIISAEKKNDLNLNKCHTKVYSTTLRPSQYKPLPAEWHMSAIWMFGII